MLGILLQEKGLLQKQLPQRKLDYFVAWVDEAYRQVAVKLTMKLRSAGWTTGFSYKTASLSKQLKEAAEQSAQKCIIIGSEIENEQLTVKNMASGGQELVDFGKFCQQCRIKGK